MTYHAVRSASDFEWRVKEKLADALWIRGFSFTMMFAALFLGIGFMSSEQPWAGLLALLWFIIMLGGSIPIYTAWRERKSVVLWVRRFHQGHSARLEQQFLEGAVLPWGQVVTLADSNLESASAARAATWLAPFLLLFLAAGWIFGWGVEVSCISAGAAWSIASFMIRGRAELRAGDWRQALASLQSRSRPPGLSGVVLKCPQDSELWRDVIKYLAPVVDAVVISAPEDTPQLEWEVKTLQARLGSSKMILLKQCNIFPRLAGEAMPAIDVPDSGSWWHNYRVSYFGAAWKQAMTTILRAIESDRPARLAGSGRSN